MDQDPDAYRYHLQKLPDARHDPAHNRWHNARSERSRGGVDSSLWRHRADRNFPYQSAHLPDATAAAPSQVLPSLMQVEQLIIRAGKKPIAPGGLCGWTAPVSTHNPVLWGLSTASGLSS